MTTEPPADPPAGGDPPAADPPGGTPPVDDLSTLFTPEEVTAKKEAMAAAQAEETRRAGLTEEQRAEEDRQKAEEAAKNGVPEEYAEFAAAEGIVLDPAMLDEFKPLAKELGLNQESAQKLVDLAAKMQQRTVDGMFEAHEQRKADWLKTAQADPEIGEDVKLWDGKDPKSAANSVALRAFNTISAQAPGLKAMVDELGIGNHPEFIRVFYRIGKNMREDTFEQGGRTGGGETSTAKALWPGMN